MHNVFPDPNLAEFLLPYAFDEQDGAHDEAHLLRVWRNANQITAEEGGDTTILMAAVLLHDCVYIDKDSPERGRASRIAAAKARNILALLHWQKSRIDEVVHAIEAHSFSAGIEPISLEAKVLQDADRLDAIGFIGAARCFYVAGMRRASIHHAADPEAKFRELDESAYALDHFATKLLRLGENFCTDAGRKMAADRIINLREFYTKLMAEVC